MAATLAAGLAALDAQTPSIAPEDWPQLNRDSRRSGHSPLQVDPPYCYAWKWYEAPIANRAQPVVASGRLYVGSLDGILFARDAHTGGPLWQFSAGGPIRHSAAVLGGLVVFGSQDGFTYALTAGAGTVAWKAATGASATAPLVDATRYRVFVASTTGRLTALDGAAGRILWQYDAGAPILTSPALSEDGVLVVFGSEAIEAIAVDAVSGAERWRRSLQGQSLADRSPLVVGSKVLFRSQPVHSFHSLLHEGDQVMDQAGPVHASWATDWNSVKPRIVSFLTAEPTKQTLFVLDVSSGAPAGVAPVLYTFGTNDAPALPVARGADVYLPYRARHGIQTDSTTAVHVTSKYDAELGRMNLATLDITGLRQHDYPAFDRQFRMTSDEPEALTIGGNLLFVDNWERLGGIELASGALVHLGGVSNDWPECVGQCSPGTPNPFFPMMGSGPAYPFPSPRVSEGHVRPGVVIASNLIYWRVIEGGLAAFAHQSESTCPAPVIWQVSQPPPSSPEGARVRQVATTARPFADYVTLDLTSPASSPPGDLVARLREEVRAITSAGDHLMPLYLERGFSNPALWPNVTANPPGPPAVDYKSTGSVFWHDPGELLYTMALAYPYLETTQQSEVRVYMSAEMNRYPPLANLPWHEQPWLKNGVAREPYAVPFRASLNNWPPPAASIQALYALWLWSRNTNDWSYAESMWTEARALFAARKDRMTYYADIAGAIGYARLASHFGETSAVTDGTQAAIAAMTTGQDFNAFRDRAQTEYKDPRDQATGLYMPVFYGLTPEVGLYLREHVGSASVGHIHAREQGDALRWWYLTRAGAHAERGESSYVAPIASWSHFLAHAYVLQDAQSTLRQWLDRPWARGDLYSIQKLIATIQARP